MALWLRGHLPDNTSQSVIHGGLIVLNLQTWLQNSLICSRDKIIQRVTRALKDNGLLFRGIKRAQLPFIQACKYFLNSDSSHLLSYSTFEL